MQCNYTYTRRVQLKTYVSPRNELIFYYEILHDYSCCLSALTIVDIVKLLTIVCLFCVNFI